MLSQILRVVLMDLWIGGVAAHMIGVVGQLVDVTSEQPKPGLTGLCPQHQPQLHRGQVFVPGSGRIPFLRQPRRQRRSLLVGILPSLGLQRLPTLQRSV